MLLEVIDDATGFQMVSGNTTRFLPSCINLLGYLNLVVAVVESSPPTNSALMCLFTNQELLIAVVL